MKCLFYYKDGNCNVDRPSPQLRDNPYSEELWKPSLGQLVPRGMDKYPFLVWSLMSNLRLFASTGYCLWLICHNNLLVHRTCVFPRYFRFPFMSENDLQIGDTWTLPEYRCRGLATQAIFSVLAHKNSPDRKFWYVTEENNISSIKVIEKAGFIKYGYGMRNKRLGLSILGSFQLETTY
jgi:hypothetical protein